MKIKLIITLFIISLSFIIALAYIGFIAVKDGAHDFLIAVPNVNGGGIPITKLEEVNENKFMLTYENRYDKSVRVLQSNYAVVLKGTNETYPHVMNYSVTNGGFFTKDALANKNNVVVLNEKAAFDMFGTLNAVGSRIRIDMAPYIVNGVISDGDDENMNVFIPATNLSETAETIMVALSQDNGLTEEYVKNELKHIGISELKYDFINLGLIIQSIKDNVFAALKIALLGILLFAGKKSAKTAYANWQQVKRLHHECYLAELLKDEARPVQKLILLTMFTVVMIVSVLSIIMSLFGQFLAWNSIRGAFSGIHYDSFVMSVESIEKLYFLSNISIIGFLAIYTMFAATIWDEW